MRNFFERYLRQHSAFAALVLVLLVIGMLSAGNYGETGDDQNLQTYADHTVQIYRSIFVPPFISNPGFDDLPYYGPAFLIAAQLGLNLFGNPGWVQTEYLWHLFIFLSFLVGLIAIYSLAMRLVSKQVALTVTGLFASQPLLWGHGFINAKDVPLMAFFTLAVAVGLRLERYFPENSWNFEGLRKAIAKDWKKAKAAQRSRLMAGARAFVFLLAILLVSSLLWSSLINAVLGWLAGQEAASWAGQLFTRLAPNAGELPLSGYVSKAVINLWRAGFTIIGIWLLYLLVLSARLFKTVWVSLLVYIKSILWTHSKGFWKKPAVWGAGILLGIAVDVRIIGPLAGILVLVYLVWKAGPRALAVALPYSLISMLTTYVLWPYLWAAPVTNFFYSMSLMSNFPWTGQVLFNGEVIRPKKLPWDYLPVMMGIQLTIPALVVALGGVWLGIRKLVSRSVGLFNAPLVGSLLLWFAVPFLYVILAGPPMYNNFRQFLFILPPLFLLGALALQWVYVRVPKVLFWTVVIVAILPGLVSILLLHPYEYVYYNQLVGGLPGAEGRFELDYWSTSLTEATRGLNQVAPQNSFVVSWGSLQIVEHVARPDFRLERLKAANYDPTRDYDYVILPLRASRWAAFSLRVIQRHWP